MPRKNSNAGELVIERKERPIVRNDSLKIKISATMPLGKALRTLGIRMQESGKLIIMKRRNP